MDLGCKLLLALTLSILARSEGRADEAAAESDNLVEIEFPASELVAYKNRRRSSVFTAALQYEPVPFSGYTSQLTGDSYATLFGKTGLPLVSIQFGYKLNIPLIGVELAALYGTGALNDSRSGQRTGLTLSKMGGKASIYIDGLFPENYLVPYGSLQFVQWNVGQKNEVDSLNKSTGWTTGMQGGLLIALNWMDKRSALQAYNDGGLNDSYFDVFMSKYSAPKGEGDPVLESDFAIGGGFRLEF